MQVALADDTIQPTHSFESQWTAFADTLSARYLLAMALVVLALAMTLVLQHFEQDRPTLFLFFAAIVAAAWFGGVGPGCFAVAASIPAGIYFYSAALHEYTINLDNVVLFLFFGACAMAGGFLSSRQRHAEEGLQRAHRELQIKARELESMNATLLSEIAVRRRAELALQDSQSELARVARLTTMGELAASIAHEINQPLAAVVTTAESCQRWLEREHPDIDRARAAARRIVRDGNRASEVVRRIRAMVRKALPERTTLNVNTVIQDALSLMEPDLRKNGVVVRTALVDKLPCMQGDRTLLQQVFVNLITNAMESMTLVDSGNTLLQIDSAWQLDGTVAVNVRDSGAGIADDARERLFDAFVTTKKNGMGLGLSICRSIVEAHGGSLSATTASPHGAVFHVTLSQSGA